MRITYKTLKIRKNYKLKIAVKFKVACGRREIETKKAPILQTSHHTCCESYDGGFP